MAKIRKGIHRAGIIIADITINNPNVLYETGIAHEAGKEVIFLIQELIAVPFDIKGQKFIHYNSANQNEFVDTLMKEIEIYKNSFK